MKSKKPIILPRYQRMMAILGENIRLARLRRKFSSAQVAERSGMARPTYSKIEKGDPSVSMGSYVQVLSILGLASDIESVAKDDEFGRKLQDAELLVKKRAPKAASIK